MPTDSQALITAARGLRAEGLTFSQIAATLHCAPNTARRWTLALHGRNERPEPERSPDAMQAARSERRRLVALYQSAGWPVARIAAELAVSRATVYSDIRIIGKKGNGPAE